LDSGGYKSSGNAFAGTSFNQTNDLNFHPNSGSAAKFIFSATTIGLGLSNADFTPTALLDIKSGSGGPDVIIEQSADSNGGVRIKNTVQSWCVWCLRAGTGESLVARDETGGTDRVFISKTGVHLGFGGLAAGNAGIKGNGTTVQARLGDDSADTAIEATKLNTATNCSSSAAPAVCGSASAGSFVVAAAATTVTVNTTAVTANSQILLQEDQSLGAKLSVTCNTQSILVLGPPVITARSAGTSFSVAIVVAPTTNPMCVSYTISN
jgi:hypothetical protein